jgi:hypothetical protein
MLVRMRSIGFWIGIACVAFSFMVPIGGSGAQAAATTTPATVSSSVRWLAAGDSYASGQGLVDRSGVCARASGISKTWAQVAAATLSQQGYAVPNPQLVACSGAKSTAFFASQDGNPPQWRPSMGRYQLVTFSFGGDDVGFKPIITACYERIFSDSGCSDANVRHAIKKVATGYPGFLQQVAVSAVTSGGHVVVMGYPELIELPNLWPRTNRLTRVCQFGLDKNDANLIRGWAGVLNAAIGSAVKAANSLPATARNNVTFTFVDPVSGNNGISSSDPNLFEPASGTRHELCSKGDANWLNGVSARVNGVQPTSFHPTQDGTTAMGNLAAEEMANFFGTPSAPCDPSAFKTRDGSLISAPSCVDGWALAEGGGVTEGVGLYRSTEQGSWWLVAEPGDGLNLCGLTQSGVPTADATRLLQASQAPSWQFQCGSGESLPPATWTGCNTDVIMTGVSIYDANHAILPHYPQGAPLVCQNGWTVLQTIERVNGQVLGPDRATAQANGFGGWAVAYLGEGYLCSVLPAAAVNALGHAADCITVPSTTTTTPPPPPSAGSLAAFAGKWTAHDTAGVNLDSQGNGTVGFPDFVACPSCFEASAPFNTISFKLTSVQNGVASGSITASTDPDGLDPQGNVQPGAFSVGTPVQVTIVPASPGLFLQLNMSGDSQFCDLDASETNQCGA